MGLLAARGASFERRVLHTWMQVGDLLEEAFTLHNASPFPLLAAEIDDRSDLPGYNLSTVRAAGANSQTTWRLRGRSRRRGVFRLGPTTVRFGDPLGMFGVTCDYPHTREVLVFPPVLHDLSVPGLAGGGQGQAASRQRSLAETAAIGGVRDYRPGDPIRRIHWPLSARHQTFLVKEFDREMGGNVWLVLDLDPQAHAGSGDNSTLEYAVIWTASWAWHLLRAGKGVGLVACIPQPVVIPPASGSAQLWQMLRVLAPVEAQANLPLAALLRDVQPRLRRGNSLVIVTPSTSSDWPPLLAQPVLRAAVRDVVLLDAASFEQAQDPGSVDGIRAVLAGLGIGVQVVRCQPGLHASPAAPGGGDWEFRVTPHGRVIVRARPADVRS